MTPGGDAPAPRPRSDLPLRLVSSVVMMAITLGAVFAGGWVFAALTGLACALILVEWAAITGPFVMRVTPRAAIGFVALTVVAAVFDAMSSVAALFAVAAGLALGSVIDPRSRWLAAGVLYAGLPGIAAVLLRGSAPAGEASAGFVAIVFVFLVVWTTDSAAYFAGRALGGPKLMPRVSPKKTWSGAIGGLAGAVAIGVAIGLLAGYPALGALALVAAGLSILSQIGDLAESWIKRHFGVKDSGRLIPGHGGIMDRVDGLVVALVAGALLGALRNGPGGAGAGLMIW